MEHKDKAIALCRVSTKHQRTDGHSLEQQEESIKQAAAELNCEIVKVWSLDISSKAGLNVKRKDLEEIRQYCKEHNDIKYFLVDRVSRLMREAKRFIWYTVELEDRGVKTFFTAPDQRNLNNDNQMAMLMQFFTASQAEQENREKALVNKQKMQSRISEGYYPFPIRQGYMKSETPALHIPDPIRFPLLQQSFRKILVESYTPNQALKWLHTQGYTTPLGNQLDIEHYMRILRQPYYAGALWVKDWPRKDKGLHQAMITLDEWHRLQELISSRRPKFERQQHNPDFPLNKSLCECGGKLVGFNHQNGKGWSKPKYRCRDCGKQFRQEVVHAEMSSLLNKIVLKDSQRTPFLEALSVVFEERRKDSINHIKLLQGHREKLIDKKDGLIESLAVNPELAVDTKRVIEKVSQEISAIETEINTTDELKYEFIKIAQFGLDFTQNYDKYWWKLSHANRLKCKQMLFPQDFCVKKTGKVYTPEISPLNRLASNKKDSEIDSESLLVELEGIAPSSTGLFVYRLQA